MHDIKAIRTEPDRFVKGWEKRGLGDPQSLVDGLIALDADLRAAVAAKQAAETARNAASKQIGAAKAKGDEAEFERLRAEVAGLKDTMEAEGAKEDELREKLTAQLSGLPNLPAEDVPVGPDEESNEEVRKAGEPPRMNFEPKDHVALGEGLGMMDFEKAAQLSGARFVVLKGQLARMERALSQFMLDVHTQEFGYEEVSPPFLVKDDALYGTGQLPKFEVDLYKTQNPFENERQELIRIGEALREKITLLRDQAKSDRDLAVQLNHSADSIRNAYFHDERSESATKSAAEELGIAIAAIRSRRESRRSVLPELRLQQVELRRRIQDLHTKGYGEMYLIPTAEVPLTNLVREDITPEDQLPKRMTAWTPCFRSEAGSAGRDTRGMIRVHQFQKVELVSITTPEQSNDEHERMTACAEEILNRLGLAYRVMLLSTGDMGFGAQKTYDLEVWLPSQGCYREISSCSNCGDFQARRMNARCRAEGEKQTRFLHTLNGSGVAVGRALVAVLENYQQADGSVVIPEALRPYMGGLERISAA